MNTKNEAEVIKPSTSLLEIPDEIYLCKYCNDIYNDPHQAECGCRYCFVCYQTIKNEGKCKLCGEEINYNATIKDVGFRKDMNNLVLKCKNCDWKGKFMDFNKHYQADHSTICPYSSIGCKHLNSTDKQTLNEHLNSHFFHHLQLVQENFDFKLNRLESKIFELKKCNSSEFDGNIRNKSAEIDELNSRIINFQKINESIKSELAECMMDSSKILSAIENHEKKFNKLSEDLDLVKQNLISVQCVNMRLDEAMMSFKYVPQNGIYIWKITNITEKLNNARAGKQPFIYSPAFYTSTYGYKICAKAYLNGDSRGKNEYISLYFALMRGEYDPLLKWPFSQKITFIIVDQKTDEEAENIIDSFKPAVQIQPTSEMNPACGISLFCKLSRLHADENAYIKDDCMFIKVVVDMRGLENV